MVELHAHSTASDGALSPKRLVALAASEKLTALALTDHDTVDGLDEAVKAAEQYGIQFLPGIELEVDFNPGTFHLLGLALDRWTGRVRKRLEQSKKYRKERNLEMVRLMQEAGIPITYRELTELSGHDTVGRPHFAALLHKKGVIGSPHEAYASMIGNHGKFYRQKKSPHIGQACAAIHAAGGVAVLAHPHTLELDLHDLQRSLLRWKSEGLDGIEAYNATAPIEDGHRFAALGRELGLVVTAGSDFHTPYSGSRRIGIGPGGMPIEDAIIDELLEYKHGLR
ncbi:MAG: PHP domain-containing protein [Spirochaetales bacterium]